MKHGKHCEMPTACWSGFTGVIGIAFIIVATILTLITMNGLGILGMFFVGLLLCRKKWPCCDAHHCMCSAEEKPKSKPKAKPKKTVVKK